MVCLDHLAYLDLKELLDLKEMKDQQDLQVPLVKLDQEENLDYLASLELMVCLARMEHLAKLDLKGTKVLRVILVLWDFLALEESKEILVKEELWEQKETEAFPDHLENKGRKDHKVLKAQKVPLENLDQLDHLERREKMDHQVLLGIQEDQEIRVTRELREEMVHLE